MLWLAANSRWVNDGTVEVVVVELLLKQMEEEVAAVVAAVG